MDISSIVNRKTLKQPEGGRNQLGKDDFLKLMASYMPYEHRQFVYWMRGERMSMVQCIAKIKECGVDKGHRKEIEGIQRMANQCLAKLRKFRNKSSHTRGS